jgi:prepilin-type N-terminal cleavage/methylation domain-containing protein
MTKAKKHNGFTLIEILLGLSLFSVLLVTVNLVIFNTLKAARRTEAVNRSRSEGALIIDRISREIEFSQNVTACAANSLSLTRPNLTTAVYALVGTTVRLNGTTISSSQVTVSNHPDCPAMFTCTAGFITVCFGINTPVGTDSSDVANSTGAIKFSNQVIRRNNI